MEMIVAGEVTSSHPSSRCSRCSLRARRSRPRCCRRRDPVLARGGHADRGPRRGLLGDHHARRRGDLGEPAARRREPRDRRHRGSMVSQGLDPTVDWPALAFIASAFIYFGHWMFGVFLRDVAAEQRQVDSGRRRDRRRARAAPGAGRPRRAGAPRARAARPRGPRADRGRDPGRRGHGAAQARARARLRAARRRRAPGRRRAATARATSSGTRDRHHGRVRAHHDTARATGQQVELELDEPARGGSAGASRRGVRGGRSAHERGQARGGRDRARAPEGARGPAGAGGRRRRRRRAASCPAAAAGSTRWRTGCARAAARSGAVRGPAAAGRSRPSCLFRRSDPHRMDDDGDQGADG